LERERDLDFFRSTGVRLDLGERGSTKVAFRLGDAERDLDRPLLTVFCGTGEDCVAPILINTKK